VVTADLTVQINEKGYPKEYNLLPVLTAANGEMHSSEVEVPDTGYKIKIAAVNASSGEVQLAVLSPSNGNEEAKDMLAIELSEKPFISVLWFGTIIFIIGSFFTILNRVRSGAKKE
jgi:cytochrome c biogenesis factor